jgi:hypothetical protein
MSFSYSPRSLGLRFGERESEAEAERRRERSWSETTVAEPQAESRRSFGICNASRDERAFLRNGAGAVVRGFGRTAAGEVEQENALVTAGPELFSNQASGFIHERVLKGTGIGVESGRLEA